MRIVLLLLLLVTSSSVAEAHEFWIRPGNFSPEVGGTIRAQLFVGDGFAAGEEFARSARHLRSFRAIAGSTRSEIRGINGRKPAGYATFERPGLGILAYESEPSLVRLSAVDFAKYLREEGLDAAALEREKAGESNRPVKETFRRCAKSLLRVRPSGKSVSTDATPSSDGEAATAIGMDFELVPSLDPTRLLPTVSGENKSHYRLPVRLLWKGKPVAGTRIRMFLESSKSTPSPSTQPVPATQTAAEEAKPVRFVTTDANGRATLDLQPGVWMLSSVRLERADPGERHDWESVWTSLTFQISDSPSVRKKVLKP